MLKNLLNKQNDYLCCMLLKSLFLISVLGLLPFPGSAQPLREENILEDRIYSETIRTVELYRTGWRMSDPVLQKDETNTLTLDFDDLSDNPETYYYTFVHCDAGWKPTDLFPEDYLDGYTENEIRDYESSVNTTVPYVHYHLTFPNEEVRFRITGNYIVEVYKDADPDHPAFTARFMITSGSVSITGKATRTTGPDRLRNQQLLLTIDYGSLPLRSPADELYVVIRQNGRWDNAVRGPHPSENGNGRLVYGIPSGIIFPGGNEYRNLDIKSVRYQSPGILKIDYNPPYYNVILEPAKIRSLGPYLTKKDLNGRFFIENSRGSTSDTDADYFNVFFTLPANFPFEGNVYIFGALSQWNYTQRNRMLYNEKEHRYEATMMLKQGMYNYLYAVKTPEAATGDLTRIEGSHWETENDYTILVYYRDPGERYDRLVGLNTINSITVK